MRALLEGLGIGVCDAVSLLLGLPVFIWMGKDGFLFGFRPLGFCLFMP